MAVNEHEQQLKEYESQLEEINSLIASDPNNASFQSLRNDVVELISLTKAQVSSPRAPGASSNENGALGTAAVASHSSVPAAENGKSNEEDSPSLSLRKNHFDDAKANSDETTYAHNVLGSSLKSGKKKTVSLPPPPAEFEIPPHLIPLESDSEGIKKQKRRTIKALKRKWKERVREAELGQKQRGWQDFVSGRGGGKKKRKKGDSKLVGLEKMQKKGSIFATEDGVNARVGVVGSGRGLTEYAKRVKHG